MTKSDKLSIYTDMETIANLYMDGLPLSKIVEMTNVSYTTLRNKMTYFLEDNYSGRDSLKKIDEEILRMHDIGISKRKIAKHLNCSEAKIKLLLAKNGRVTKDDLMKPELLEKVREDYEAGLSLKSISKKYKMNVTTVSVYLIVAGGTINFSKGNGRNKDFEEYFDELDKKKAYDLGLLFSMCAIYKVNANSKRVDLVVLQKYKKYITHMKESMKLTGKIYAKTNTNSFFLNTCSLKLANRLENYGLKKEFPILHEDIQKYFYNGYFQISVKIQRAGIRIMLRYHDPKNLISYLNKIGIDKNSIIFNKDSLVIYQNDELERLIRTHPDIYDLLMEHVNERGWNTKWSRFIIRFREFKLDRNFE